VFQLDAGTAKLFCLFRAVSQHIPDSEVRPCWLGGAEARVRWGSLLSNLVTYQFYFRSAQ
jgi:hypothetical protein